MGRRRRRNPVNKELWRSRIARLEAKTYVFQSSPVSRRTMGFTAAFASSVIESIPAALPERSFFSPAIFSTKGEHLRRQTLAGIRQR